MGKKKKASEPKIIDNSLLTKFIQDEMKLRGIEFVKDFAKIVDVSHTTIGRVFNNKELPSLDTLIKLSKATDKDIRMIIALVAPQQVRDVKPQSLMLAQRIDRLSEDTKQMIDTIIINTLLYQQNQDKNSGEIGVVK